MINKRILRQHDNSVNDSFSFACDNLSSRKQQSP